MPEAKSLEAGVISDWIQTEGSSQIVTSCYAQWLTEKMSARCWGMIVVKFMTFSCFFFISQYNRALFCLLRCDRWSTVQDWYRGNKEGGSSECSGARFSGSPAHPGEFEICTSWSIMLVFDENKVFCRLWDAHVTFLQYLWCWLSRLLLILDTPFNTAFCYIYLFIFIVH